MLPICQDNAMQPSRVQGCCPQIIDLAADHKPHCRTLWVYVMFWSLATTCPVPLITHFEVIRPSTPTGPRAWMRLVLMPTSAPSPKRNPSLKRVLALWKTQAASTLARKADAAAASLVTMVSVWPEPFVWMWSMASCMSPTTSSVTSLEEYSWRAEGAGGRPSIATTRSPPYTLTPASSNTFCRTTNPEAGPVPGLDAQDACTSTFSTALQAAG
mmetsp:Transcript_23937/g.65703  ORF Transcript_23937/g.65703 Transcript_23937/m.65703 type:complete len:214 (-) Transcript_23937:818-1459(-)